MNHFKQIAAGLEAHHLDAVLLTCEANRFYACGFHSAGSDGIAVVTRHHNYYFTDSRYTEAAGRYVQDAEIREANREHPYSALINEVIQREHITRMGYEDEYMTVADFRRFSEKLSCELVPATQLLWDLRAVKDSEELNCMIQAQRITEKAFDDILKEIRPGVSEKEIAARILYLMLHYGAEDKSFDPIVVSGPNGSLPHGVPSEKLIQDGEFVTMDIGCKFDGYCSDMTRTVAVGHVTDEMRRRGDSRKPQRHPLQPPAAAGGDRHQRGAGDLPSGEAGGADRGCRHFDGKRLSGHHAVSQKSHYFMTIMQNRVRKRLFSHPICQKYR